MDFVEFDYFRRFVEVWKNFIKKNYLVMNFLQMEGFRRFRGHLYSFWNIFFHPLINTVRHKILWKEIYWPTYVCRKKIISLCEILMSQFYKIYRMKNKEMQDFSLHSVFVIDSIKLKMDRVIGPPCIFFDLFQKSIRSWQSHYNANEISKCFI